MEFQTNPSIMAAFFLYLAVMMGFGIYYSRKQEQLSDYILGDRQLGPWLTSMSAEASDMSGWMLMGLPGYAYLNGISAFWTAIGLIAGTWMNWVFVSRRLRNYTEVASNSLTIPDYLSNRFHDARGGLRFICAVFILIFFIIYTSSGFVASGKLFETIFLLNYTQAMLLGAFVVVFYTFLGGFAAVCWTDFIQGSMMFFAVLVVPVTATMVMGGPIDVMARLTAENPGLFQLFGPLSGSAAAVVLLSSLGWGLGYFGQPHILVRFMAIKDDRELKKSTRIAMSWVIISLFCAVAIGIVGKAYLSVPLENAEAEKVFVIMSAQMFPSFITGLVWSAILAAIMSTASSQLLVTASAVSRDIYQFFIHQDASEKKLILVSRLTVLAVAVCAAFLASDPDSYIFQMVSYAWAGFGACFGPAVLMSLYWKRMTLKGAYAGIIVGGLTVIIWKYFAWFGLYELVPGFFLSAAAIWLVSLYDQAPSAAVIKEFDETVRRSSSR